MKKWMYLLLAGLGLASFFSASAKERSAFNPEAISVEAYLYLYPLVLMDVTRLQFTNVEKWDGKTPNAPMNTFGHFRAFPPLDFKAVVRPNFDTLYSILWMDLSKEPMILSIPNSDGRYYLMPSLDMWTDAFAAPGWRTTGTQAGNFAYCSPNWAGTLPSGITRIDAPTPYLWFIGRVQTDGTPKDFEAVHRFQDGLKATPLSQWGKAWTAPTGKVDPSIDMQTPPMQQVANMSGKEFFTYAAKLMKLQPPHITDFSQIARLKYVGIVPGEDLNFEKLDPRIQQALNKAPKIAQKQMSEKASTQGALHNGWQIVLGSIGVYGVDYMQRTVIAHLGLGANQEADAIYPILIAAEDGKAPSGQNKYVLHFAKDQLPPAEAFWSVTLYDKEGFAVPNAINRANLSSWMNLLYDKDGSLDLYFQSDSPGKEKESNWLPTPNQGEWNLTMRLYAPGPSAVDGTWTPSPLKKAF